MRNLIERNTFASENQRSGVSDATQESFLVARTRRCRRKKEDLSAKAKELVVVCVLCVSNRTEVRSITNISSLSVRLRGWCACDIRPKAA